MDGALVINGVVDTVARDIAKLSDLPKVAGGTWIEAPAGQVFGGFTYAGGKFRAPDASAPPPAPFSSISDRQFFQALAMQPYAIITTQEALDAVKTGEIPQVMQAVIDTLPADQQFGATMILAGGTSYERGHPLVAAFGASRGMDTAAVDVFWRFAEGL